MAPLCGTLKEAARLRVKLLALAGVPAQVRKVLTKGVWTSVYNVPVPNQEQVVTYGVEQVTHIILCAKNKEDGDTLTFGFVEKGMTPDGSVCYRKASYTKQVKGKKTQDEK